MILSHSFRSPFLYFQVFNGLIVHIFNYCVNRCIAEQRSDTFIPLKDIADRQESSQKYLEIIMRDLVRAGFLKGSSGKGDGYNLRRKPEKYSVRDILECMERSLAPVACLDDNTEPCPRASFCKTLPLWKEYEQITNDFFFGKTIADLVDPVENKN